MSRARAARAAVALALLGAARPAAAQASEPAAQPAAARAEPSPAEAEARQRFAQGAVLFERRNYEAARAEFQRVYALLAGAPRRYVVLFNIGQCEERLFRYHLALAYYRRYLAEGGPGAEDAASVRATIAALDGLLATVEVAVTPAHAEVFVDDHAVARGPGALRVPGGRHVIEARAAGFVPARREVEIAARTRAAIGLSLVRAGARPGPALFIALAGASVAAAGVGAGFGIAAVGARADVDARLARPEGAPVTEADRDHIRALALGADLSFALAAAGAVAATVVGVLTDFRGRESPRRPPAGVQWTVAPPGASGAATLGARWVF